MLDNFIPLYVDQVFIDLFGNSNNIKYSEYLLECFLGLEEGSLKNKVNVLFEHTLKRKSNDRTNRVDLIYEIKNSNTLINVECYSNFGVSELNKSIRYFTKLDDILNKKETEFKSLIQINLLKKVHLSLPKCFINEQVKNPSLKYMRLVLIRLDQTDNFGYDEDNKRSEDLRAFCKFLNAETYEAQKRLAKERNILMEIHESAIEYLRGTNLTREDFLFEKNNQEVAYDTGYSAGEESGINKGHQMGQQRALEETAKNLLKYGMPIEDIALNTTLSISEINKLKETRL